MTQNKILIIQHDCSLANKLNTTDNPKQFELVTASEPQSGLRVLYAEQPDLVLIDMELPHMEAQWLCKQIKLLADLPIIMLGDLTTPEDEIQGFTMGADDVAPRDGSPEILTARILALFRRVEWCKDEAKKEQSFHQKDVNKYNDGYLEIDLSNRQVKRQGEYVRLTSTELRMLTYLIQCQDRCLSHSEILEQVWDGNATDSKSNVHVQVSNLRRKLEIDPRRPTYLITEHGRGYRFVAQPN